MVKNPPANAGGTGEAEELGRLSMGVTGEPGRTEVTKRAHTLPIPHMTFHILL